MDIQNPNMMMQEPKKSAVGPVIGLIIILAIIIIGSLYFWGKRVDDQTQNTQVQPVQNETFVEGDIQLQQLEVQSSSDDLNSINADLNATNFGNIDAGVEELQ